MNRGLPFPLLRSRSRRGGGHRTEQHTHRDRPGGRDVLPLGFCLCRYPPTVLSTLSSQERELFLQLDDDLLLAAFLIQERVKGSASRWQPWLQVRAVSLSSLDSPETPRRSLLVFPLRDRSLRGPGDHPASPDAAQRLLQHLPRLLPPHVRPLPPPEGSLSGACVGLQLRGLRVGLLDGGDTRRDRSPPPGPSPGLPELHHHGLCRPIECGVS